MLSGLTSLECSSKELPAKRRTPKAWILGIRALRTLLWKLMGAASCQPSSWVYCLGRWTSWVADKSSGHLQSFIKRSPISPAACGAPHGRKGSATSTNRKSRVWYLEEWEAARHTVEYKPTFETNFDLVSAIKSNDADDTQVEKTCSMADIRPENIYNKDEKGFMMGRTNKLRQSVPKHLAENSKKSGVPAARSDGSREWVTAIRCICGDGSALTPARIFKGAILGSKCLADLSESARFWATTSANGWTTSHVGMKWLT